MSKKAAVKNNVEKNKAKFKEEISTLKRVLNDYKLERRANWKSFKNKMNDDMDKLKKINK